MISVRFLPQVQAFIMSGFMSLVMSGIITYLHNGHNEKFCAMWMHAWGMAFIIAFPTIMLVHPLARKLAMKIASKN